MGRIRQGHVKRAARMLLEAYPDKFSTDYEQNQHVLDELAVIESKPLKNRIAGYIVTLLKQRTKEV